MIKGLIVSLLLLLQYTPAGPVFSHGGAPPVCTAPTMANRWPVFGSGNTCNGGSPCTNGLGIDTLADVVGTNNATQATSGNRPIYTTGAINSLPSAVFNGSTSRLALSVPFLGPQTTYVAYGIRINTSGAHAFFGGATGGALEYRTNGTHQELLIENVALVGAGTSTLTNGSFVTLAATYNSGTGAWVLYTCSGGTCTVDASGTNVQSISGNFDTLGAAPGSGDFYSSDIAEFDFNNAVSIAGVGAYSLCKFGI